jgi:hypothetical protein
MIEIFYQTIFSSRRIYIPTARGTLTANFINGILYVVGGVNSTETLTSNLAYNSVSNKWTSEKCMPTARYEIVA